MLSDASEHRCQTIDISTSSLALRTPIKGRLGETVVCYLDRLGRLEGRVTRLFDDGFALSFDAPATKRQRLATLLTQRENESPAGADLRRPIERIKPTQSRIVVTLADGRHVASRIMTLSRDGAALTCPLMLLAGDAVTLGRRKSRVARSMQRLFGVVFDTPISDQEFTADIIL